MRVDAYRENHDIFFAKNITWNLLLQGSIINIPTAAALIPSFPCPLLVTL
jgi:hypothetical protein